MNLSASIRLRLALAVPCAMAAMASPGAAFAEDRGAALEVDAPDAAAAPDAPDAQTFTLAAQLSESDAAPVQTGTAPSGLAQAAQTGAPGRGAGPAGRSAAQRGLHGSEGIAQAVAGVGVAPASRSPRRAAMRLRPRPVVTALAVCALDAACSGDGDNVAGHRLEVIAIGGARAAMATKIHGDHPIGAHQPFDDRAPGDG